MIKKRDKYIIEPLLAEGGHNQSNGLSESQLTDKTDQNSNSIETAQMSIFMWINERNVDLMADENTLADILVPYIQDPSFQNVDSAAK